MLQRRCLFAPEARRHPPRPRQHPETPLGRGRLQDYGGGGGSASTAASPPGCGSCSSEVFRIRGDRTESDFVYTGGGKGKR